MHATQTIPYSSLDIMIPPSPPTKVHAECFSQKELARRIHEARQLAELKAQGELLAEKHAFMERVFHEIRTPCHMLQMLLGSLADSVGGDPAIQAQVEAAWAQGIHIAQLADDVRMTMLLQSGTGLPVHRAWFSLPSLIAETAKVLQKLSPKEAVGIQVDVQSPDAHILSDSALVGTIIRHLLSNALKFTDAGDVTINVAFDGPPKAANLTIIVTNPGPPIPSTEVAQMRYHYWMGSGPQTGGSPLEIADDGFGIGLYLSHHLAHVLGGELDVEVTPEGTRFRLDVPVEVADGDRAGLSASQSCSTSFQVEAAPSGVSLTLLQPPTTSGVSTCCAPSTSLTTSFSLCRTNSTLASTRKAGQANNKPRWASKGSSFWRCLVPWSRRAFRMTPPSPTPDQVTAPVPPLSPRPPHVLVVEDNALCLRVACRCLEGAGFGYTVAANGKVACDEVAKDSSRFDVILMDLRMPVMDGLAATQFIRRDLGVKTPIIVLSAESSESTLGSALRAGADGFLTKPTTPQSIINMIRRYCPSDTPP
jgi:signal transduction histidine kinase/CheY-like chemotaxis protein